MNREEIIIFFDYPTVEEFGVAFYYLCLSVIPLLIGAALITMFPLIVFLPEDEPYVEELRLKRLFCQRWIVRLITPPSMIFLSIAMILILDVIFGGVLAFGFVILSLLTFLPDRNTENPYDILMERLEPVSDDEDAVRAVMQDFVVSSNLLSDEKLRIFNYLLDRDDSIGIVAAEFSTEIEVEQMYGDMQETL